MNCHCQDTFANSARIRHITIGIIKAFSCLQVSYLEEGFMRSLGVSLAQLEPRAELCTRVWVWHTRTERAAAPRLEHIQNEKYEGTNIGQLYRNLHAK